MFSHDECQDLIPGYVLDILEADDRLPVEEHLAVCSDCAVAAMEAAVVMHHLAGLVVPRQIPPGSWQRVLSRLRLDRSEPAAADKGGAMSKRLARWWGWLRATPVTIVSRVKTPVPRRMAWMTAGASLVAVLVVTAAVSRWERPGKPSLVGGVFSDPPPAPEFTLSDQNGRLVSPQGLRGQVVALTFLYTHCPDICPMIASTLAAANRRLGPGAQDLQMVAVSVDPTGDSLPAIRKFIDDHGLADVPNWHYVFGSPAQLHAVWHDYHIDSSAPDLQEPASIQGVDHTALVYLISRDGRLRVVLPANLNAGELVDDVHTLQAL